jgi:hypothetical protein
MNYCFSFSWSYFILGAASYKLQVTSYKLQVAIFFAFCFLLASCAKIVSPSGGPKDITPPVVVNERPPNGSTNFDGRIIKITLDEFVTLNNPTENIIFSPPLNHPVDYSTKGKSVVVRINDTLKENTTYNILFSDCIQDFHEGNKLSGYNYAFSTGDSIDQHELFGVVINAETNKPEVGIFVMLYDNDIDSLPLSTRPNYLTKTNENGEFFLYHLKPNYYKIFALKDINSDLIYNLPNEIIAFKDSMVEAKYYDSDSLRIVDTNDLITLRSFQEEDTVQLLSHFINPQNGIYRFPFKIPVHSFDFQIKSDTIIDFFSSTNTIGDTLSLYLKTFFKDTATVFIKTDFERVDSVDLLPFKTPQTTGKRTAAPVKQSLKVNLTNKDNLYAPVMLNFSYPVKPVDSVSMLIIATLLSGKDTTEIYVNIPDTFVMQVPVPFTFEPKINYTLWSKDSLFYGYDNTSHDTLTFSFSKKTEKDYGNLIINYKVANNNGSDFIVELLSSNQNVVFKDIISVSKTVEYRHLLPGTYRIRMIEDRNKNGKWDTGNYRKKKQPENIFFFNKEIIIRGFWDVEENVDLRVP